MDKHNDISVPLKACRLKAPEIHETIIHIGKNSFHLLHKQIVHQQWHRKIPVLTGNQTLIIHHGSTASLMGNPNFLRIYYNVYKHLTSCLHMNFYMIF